mmetsp:Transcript_43837/g.113183  ORF Transcript_43837/g.113183 Transcript_43837/m.113183 type:complete len:159 (+) Transcript_43837:78-554(+)
MSQEWRMTNHQTPAGGYKWRADEFYSRAQNKDDHMLSPDWLQRECIFYRTFQKKVVYSRAPSQEQPARLEPLRPSLGLGPPRLQRSNSLGSLTPNSLGSLTSRSRSSGRGDAHAQMPAMRTGTGSSTGSRASPAHSGTRTPSSLTPSRSGVRQWAPLR